MTDHEPSTHREPPLPALTAQQAAERADSAQCDPAGLRPYDWWSKTIDGHCYVLICPVCGVDSVRSLGIQRFAFHRPGGAGSTSYTAWCCGDDHRDEWMRRLDARHSTPPEAAS